MADQLSLTGISPSGIVSDRLFFALVPDLATAVCLAQFAHRLQAKHGLRGRPLTTDRFHVTLLHIGDYVGLPPAVVRTVHQVAGTLKTPPFEVVFDRVESFRNNSSRHPCVLQGTSGLVALTAFRQTLRDAVLKSGITPLSGPAFTPHITLIYDEQILPAEPSEPIAWTAREFVLIHSLLGQTRYIPLGRWPLNG